MCRNAAPIVWAALRDLREVLAPDSSTAADSVQPRYLKRQI
jgi:hypothetical protein